MAVVAAALEDAQSVLTYRVRPRVLKHRFGEELRLPGRVEVRFHLRPPQPFGMEAGGGRTAVRGVPATAELDANNGAHTIESKPPLRPLSALIREAGRDVRLVGNVLTISEDLQSLQELEELINTTYFVLPMLLNLDFADPPYVYRVEGTANGASFRWELQEWKFNFEITTQERQEQAFGEAWDRMPLVAEASRRRLLAALHYFHVACRLARVESTPGEFLAEVVLNLSKVLEVLFPPGGDGKTRDAVRRGLTDIGVPVDAQERDFLPAMVLRNGIDVGHVGLSLFTLDQLQTIHSYTERAEGAFRGLLRNLTEAVADGRFVVQPCASVEPRPDVINSLERLKASLQQGTA